MSRINTIFLFTILMIFMVEGHAATEKRVALIIGNSTYEHATPLKNPSNDANRLADTLTRLGFEVVKGLDLNKQQFERTVRDFSKKLRGADVALLFYAGHGLQVNGTNYLAPINAKLSEEGDLDFETLPLTTIQKQMEREARTNLIFLDACRDNPLARSLARSMGRTRSAAIGRGLARVEAGNVETFIAFATDPGETASDGEGEHSPFTNALLKHIDTPNLDVAVMMRRVRRDVMSETKERQRPWTNSSLTREFQFNPKAASVEPESKPSPTPTPLPANNQAERAWNAIKDTDSHAILESFIAQFPDSIYAIFATARLKELKAEEQNSNAQTERQRLEQEKARFEKEKARLEAERRQEKARLEQEKARLEGLRQRQREQQQATYADPPPKRRGTPKPSYNCKYARLPSEKAICNSVDLSDLDVEMAELYYLKLSRSGSRTKRWLKSTQKDWLSTRNACRSDFYCLEQRYLERIQSLSE